jgi:signal transduction histidine kinase
VQGSRRVDAVLAVLLLAGSLLDLLIASEASSGFHGPVAVSVLAAAGYCLCVAARTRAPFWSLVGLSGLFTVWLPAFYIHEPQPAFEPAVAALLVLFSAAAQLSGRRALIAGAMFAAALGVSDVPALVAGRDPGNVGPSWVIFGLAWGLGRLVHRRENVARDLAARVEQAEADREQRAREAVDDERARIARELHDVVTHAVSGIVLQAAAERRALTGADTTTRAAFGDIETSGREALTELRRLLGMLRKGSRDDLLAPAPSLRDAASMVAAAGLPVDLHIEGRPRDLPPGVDLSAYRVVQEGLTNVRKHAVGVTCVEVTIRYERDNVAITVIDNGHAARTPPPAGSLGSGFGLLGLAERVSLHAGTLTAAPTPTGGFRLGARLSYDAPPS